MFLRDKTFIQLGQRRCKRRDSSARSVVVALIKLLQVDDGLWVITLIGPFCYATDENLEV